MTDAIKAFCSKKFVYMFIFGFIQFPYFVHNIVPIFIQ